MNYYGVTRSTDHLAHYGVKGMRWGVRRAIATGNQRALDRHYRKAAKKLAKLQDIGSHRVKYGAKAAAYGAAAAGTGSVAVGGTDLLGKALNPKTRRNIADLILTAGLNAKGKGVKRAAASAENAIRKFEIEKWGRQRSGIDVNLKRHYTTHDGKYGYTGSKHIRPTNNDLVRVGAGLATAALAAKAAQNAHRAKNSDKYREKAQNFKEEMDNAFAGTEYEGHYEKTSRRQQRRRRRYN